jgi:hypothetical protein
MGSLHKLQLLRLGGLPGSGSLLVTKVVARWL